MQNVSIDRLVVNVDLLDAELKAAIPDLVIGMSTGRGQVVVHLEDAATGIDIAAAEDIVNVHDETKLTTTQQKVLQREIDLADGRLSYDVVVDPQTVTLEELAARIAWLEEEIRDLQNL